MKKNSDFLFLLRKTIESFKLSYFFEVISIFLVVIVAVLVLSLMNGVQSNHKDNIKYAESFPFIIKNLSASEAKNVRETINNMYGNIAYIYTDTNVYSNNTSSSETYILRKAEKRYYNDISFLKCFELAPFSNRDIFNNEISVSYYNSSEMQSLNFLNKGKSGGVILDNLNDYRVSYYAEKGVFSSPGMIYSIMSDDSLINNKSLNIGVIPSSESEKKVIKELRETYNNFDISSYRTERSDIYSALSIERFFLFFVMILLLMLILLGLYKTIYSIIKMSRDERILLLAFGKTENDIFFLYFLALYIPIFLASLLGCLIGVFLIKLDFLSNALSKFFYIYSGGAMFIVIKSEIVLLFLFVVFLAFFMLIHALKKNCKIVIREVSLDERNY